MNKVFVGSDQRMGAAERVLEYSLRKHTDLEVEIVWMRSGDPGWDQEWNRGRPQGLPYSRKGWATDFTCFRYAIPELMGFQGRAVYLDADMLILGDIRELFEVPIPSPYVLTAATHRFDVLTWDCAAAREYLPSLKELKAQSNMGSLRQRLLQHSVLNHDKMWDVCDGVTPGMKLLHFTNMRTQPWHPWPEAFNYPDEHPNLDVQKMWEEYERDAR